MSRTPAPMAAQEAPATKTFWQRQSPLWPVVVMLLIGAVACFWIGHHQHRDNATTMGFVFLLICVPATWGALQGDGKDDND